MKLKLFKNGATVSVDRVEHNGMYIVQLRTPSGELHDKIRCDDYRMAMEYRRAFEAIAKNL